MEPKITSGVGNPSSPYFGQLLSEEDEKRLDDQGRPVVEGLTWGKSGTGLYLALAVSKMIPKADRRIIGGMTTDVPGSSFKITVGTFLGRPTLDVPYFGAALELPSDLGKDRLKQKYVIEWLVETAKEALGSAKVFLSNETGQEMGLWLGMVSQNAIEATRL